MPVLSTLASASAKALGFSQRSFPTLALSQTLGAGADRFGWDASLDATGYRLLISAPLYATGNPTGAVYVYERSGTTFSLNTSVLGTTSHDYQFGRGAALSRNGAYYSVSSGGNRHYLYSWPATQVSTATPTGSVEETTFAFTASSPAAKAWTVNKTTFPDMEWLGSDATSGTKTGLTGFTFPNRNIKSWSADRIAFGGSSNPTYSVGVYTISSSDGGLTYHSTVTSGTGTPFAASNVCPAISGDGNFLFVGFQDGTTGHLQAFQWTGSAYSYVGNITRSSTSRFGIAVSTTPDGSLVAVADDTAAAPAVYIYQRAGSTLTLKQTLTGAGSSRFGYALSVGDDGTSTYVAIGAFNEGKLYIYKG